MCELTRDRSLQGDREVVLRRTVSGQQGEYSLDTKLTPYGRSPPLPPSRSCWRRFRTRVRLL